MNGIVLIGFTLLIIVFVGMIKLIGSMFTVVRESSSFYLKLLYFRFFALLALLTFAGIFFICVKYKTLDQISFRSNKAHV